MSVFENEGANHGNGFSTLRGSFVGCQRRRVLLLPAVVLFRSVRRVLPNADLLPAVLPTAGLLPAARLLSAAGLLPTSCLLSSAATVLLPAAGLLPPAAALLSA